MEEEKRPTKSDHGDKPSVSGVINDIERLKPEEQEKVAGVIVEKYEVFSGPLPHPDIMKEYQQISPDQGTQ